MMLMAVMVSSVFSVVLSTKQTGGKSDRKLLAAQSSKELTAMLKGFVSDPTARGFSEPIDGPNANHPSNKWALDDSTQSPPITCGLNFAAPSVHYALAAGTHTVTGILPAWFEAAPYLATMKYYVNISMVSGQELPEVAVDVNWTEP
jgi:hypothetical protein